MGNVVRLVPVEDVPAVSERRLVSVDGTQSWLPEMTATDARRLAVALLEAAEEASPAPTDTGVLPYGWRRLSLVVPELAEAPVVDLVAGLRAERLGYLRTANALNARGLVTRSGGPWHTKAVERLVKANPPETRKRWTVPTDHRFL